MNNEQTLMVASYEGDYPKVEELLNTTDVNVNARDEDGNTALIYATQKNDPRMVELLLRNAANPDIKNSTDDTALIIAASNNYGQVVATLLNYAANAFQERSDRCSAEDFTEIPAIKLMIMNQFTVRTPKDSYSIGFPMGEGTFGTVYFARSNTTGIPYALKMFNDPSSFEEELKTARSISSELDGGCDPMYICIHDVSESKRYIIYHLAKMDLYEYLVNYNPPLEQRIYIISQIIEALYKLHMSNVVHNDVKAENVLVLNPRSGLTVLADFGSSCVANPELPSPYNINPCSLFRKSTIYPPETGNIYKSHKDLISVDLYALGYLIYILLNVGSPFQGDTPSDINDVAKSNINVANPEFKNRLDTFADKVVSYNPSERFSDIESLKKSWYEIIN